MTIAEEGRARAEQYDGQHCPECGGQLMVVQGGDADRNGVNDYQSVKCAGKCGKRWTEHWSVVSLDEEAPDPCPNCGNDDLAQRASFLPADRGDTGYQCKACEHVWYSELQRELE